MKDLQLLLLIALVTLISAIPYKSAKPSFHINPDCAKGVEFWCENISSAKKCNAVDFCISAVWSSHYSDKDSDAICDDCKEWVGKARSFIENKDTSDEIIKSLKFTCGLIPVASLQTSCEELVDENVPEILKMLESSMDPDAVCSKLKFCNNLEFDKALKLATKEKLLPFTCSQCSHIGSVIEQQFKKADTDEILEKMLGFCGELSSFSDSCSTIIMTNFDDIHKALKEKIHANNICSVSGACEAHQRAGIADIILSPTADPNIVCDLCEQMMLHLRELLIINTSEVEFKNMMIGFCHQMGKFSDECTQITDQYYDVVYKFLENNLSANKTCIAIGICKGSENNNFLMPVMPLVSVELHPMPQNPPMDSGMIEVHMVFEESSLTLVNDGAWCTTCEYVVHFIQDALAKPSVDTKLEDVLKNVCKTIPKRFQGDCIAFVDLYGDAMMSLWGQSMDARLICPKIKMCPPNLSLKVLQDNAVEEKPTCPFCLMALQEVHDLIESNKTRENIQNALSKLCNHLSDKLMSQCTEFVKDYSNDVVDMLLADFTPQDACSFLSLCTDKAPKLNIVAFDFDDTEEVLANPQCQLCKEIIKIVEKNVANKHSKDEIRRELEKSCDRLKKFSAKCKSFVDKYADKIVDLIMKQMGPDEVCKELTFCVSVDDAESQDYDSGLDIFAMAMKKTEENEKKPVAGPLKTIEEQPQCVICEFVMSKLKDELNDKSTDKEIEDALKNVCSKLPASVTKSCQSLVDSYFNLLVALLEMQKPSEVCAMLKLCSGASGIDLDDLEDLQEIRKVQDNVYECAVCKGVVEGVSDIVDNPQTDTDLENLEEKVCEIFAGKYKDKCFEIAKKYGLLMLTLIKNQSDSDEVCFKLDLCSEFEMESDSGLALVN